MEEFDDEDEDDEDEDEDEEEEEDAEENDDLGVVVDPELLAGHAESSEPM